MFSRNFRFVRSGRSGLLSKCFSLEINHVEFPGLIATAYVVGLRTSTRNMPKKAKVARGTQQSHEPDQVLVKQAHRKMRLWITHLNTWDDFLQGLKSHEMILIDLRIIRGIGLWDLKLGKFSLESTMMIILVRLNQLLWFYRQLGIICGIITQDSPQRYNDFSFVSLQSQDGVISLRPQKNNGEVRLFKNY